MARWQAAGADARSLAGIDVRVGDLGGTTLGLASGHSIWLDDNAAVWGWFVDPTPGDDSEFLRRRNQGEMNRINLLTVLEQEIAHLVGHDHEEGGIMSEALAAGQRLTFGGVYVGDPQVIAAPPGTDDSPDPVTGRRKV